MAHFKKRNQFTAKVDVIRGGTSCKEPLCFLLLSLPIPNTIGTDFIILGSFMLNHGLPMYC